MNIYVKYMHYLRDKKIDKMYASIFEDSYYNDREYRAQSWQKCLYV